jgi:hypothetical protein|nr:hypothetical protein [uncultured Anaerostipes sp.]
MIDPCKACAELNCMGICADKVKQKEHLEEIRQQLIDLCERTRNDRERKEREEKRVPESI